MILKLVLICILVESVNLGTLSRPIKHCFFKPVKEAWLLMHAWFGELTKIAWAVSARFMFSYWTEEIASSKYPEVHADGSRQKATSVVSIAVHTPRPKNPIE
jgi:hypothetical protein